MLRPPTPASRGYGGVEVLDEDGEVGGADAAGIPFPSAVAALEIFLATVVDSRTQQHQASADLLCDVLCLLIAARARLAMCEACEPAVFRRRVELGVFACSLSASLSADWVTSEQLA